MMGLEYRFQYINKIINMKYIIIFPNTDPTLDAKICIGAANIEAETPEIALDEASVAVPLGWPMLVYQQNEYDKVFHTAYEPDWSQSKKFGTNEKIRNNFLGMGYTETF